MFDVTEHCNLASLLRLLKDNNHPYVSVVPKISTTFWTQFLHEQTFAAQVPHENRRSNRPNAEQHEERPRGEASLRARERPLQARPLRRGQHRRLHLVVHGILRKSLFLLWYVT